MSGNTIETNQTPRYEITIAGQTLTQSDGQGLEYLFVEDHVDMIGVAHLTFGLDGLEWGSFEIGGDVEIKMGGSDRKIFVGYVTGFRHSWQKGKETLTVMAMDPLCKMAASRRTKVYEESKDSDVVSAAISAAGVSAGTVDGTSETHKYIFQRNESDLNLAKRLAARNGYLLLANEGKVDFIKAQFSGSAVEVEQSKLMALDYSFSDMNVPKSLTVYGWDYVTKEKVEGTASSGDVTTIGGGDNVVSKTGQIWQEDSYISDVYVSSQSGAKAMAVGELNRLARSFLRGRAVLQGNGELYAGVKVEFTGHREGFNAEGYVVSSRHIVEPNKGFTTEIHFMGNTHPT